MSVRTVRIGCIVEGHGEVQALPILLRRMAVELDATVVVDSPPPIRVPKSKLVKSGELMDADDDCPAQLGPQLQKRAESAAGHNRVRAVVAQREYEAWFLAAIPSLQGRRGLPSALTAPPEPETIRGAKEWLNSRMERPYSETVDQPAFSALFDLRMARRTRSFAKFTRSVSELIELCCPLPRHP